MQGCNTLQDQLSNLFQKTILGGIKMKKKKNQKLCKRCEHLITENTCKAFPDGIPPYVLSGQISHRNHIPNDNGFIYKRKSKKKRDDGYLYWTVPKWLSEDWNDPGG